MGEADGAMQALPGDLERAAGAWERRGDASDLVRWLTREIGPEGMPRRLAVEAWWSSLERIEAARHRRPEGWPAAIDARLEPFVRAALRFSRPDGSAVFGPSGTPPSRPEMIRGLARRLSDPSLETVADWWFSASAAKPGKRKRPAPPPLPAVSDTPRPLAMLRADWTARGDFLAIDQRQDGCRVELIGGGRQWLGPGWATSSEAGPARLVRWTTGPDADLAEWSYREGVDRVVRTAVLLRGRQMALVAEERSSAERLGPRGVDLELAAGVTVQADEPGRSWRLEGRSRSAAEAVPIGFAQPGSPSTTVSAITARGNRLQLHGFPEARRLWLPLFCSWDPARTRRGAYWRTLTITQRTRPCGPEVAFAARVAWSHGQDSLLVYRSLARPALRCVLGHSITARFLVAVFTAEGELKPLVSVED